MATQDKINALQAGQSVVISETETATCSVEKSTDGKKLRYVRTYATGSFEVFHTLRLSY